MKTRHHTKSTMLSCNITLHNNGNACETVKWAVETEPELRQFWIIAAEAESKHICIVGANAELEIWVPVAQTKFVGQASSFTAGRPWFAVCVLNILVCMVVPKGVHGGLVPWILKFEKCFSVSFELLKKFNHCNFSLEMLFKYIISRHLFYAGVIIQLFSVFNVPNHFGAGTRAINFRCLELEPKPEPKF